MVLCFDGITPPSDMIDVTGFCDSAACDVITDVISVITRRSRVDAIETSTINCAVSRSTVTMTSCHLSSFKPKTNQPILCAISHRKWRKT